MSQPVAGIVGICVRLVLSIGVIVFGKERVNLGSPSMKNRAQNGEGLVMNREMALGTHAFEARRAS